MNNLRSRFKQIVGFYFVSSLNMSGIKELSNELVQVTLQQKYIGEKIPEAWFNFEKKIKSLSKKKSLCTYNEIVDIAESASLFEPEEILQAIRFLNDLGSLQYFEISGLKDKVKFH
jgi:leucine-rich repeat kinase 2